MPIPCKDCPHCETCSPTNIGAVCKPKSPAATRQIEKELLYVERYSSPMPIGKAVAAMQVHAQAAEADRVFNEHIVGIMDSSAEVARYCLENGLTKPEPKKKWVVKYSALFAAGGQPSGQFNVSAADEQEARTKAHQVIKAISKESGVDSFNLNISDDVIPERKVTTNLHMYAPYGKSAIQPVGSKCTTEEALRTGRAIHAMVQALQDGECRCCHGSWPSADATACNGCGYRLDK